MKTGQAHRVYLAAPAAGPHLLVKDIIRIVPAPITAGGACPVAVASPQAKPVLPAAAPPTPYHRWAGKFRLADALGYLLGIDLIDWLELLLAG